MAFVLVVRRLKQVTPRGDVGSTAKKRTTLPLGHPAPDAELDPVVESVG